MTIILSIAIALVAGLISTRIVKLLHLPNVTGYLVIGLICLLYTSDAADD